MYWFGKSDLAAAEAWWKRALYLDPKNTRAVECLRLLARSTGKPAPGPEPQPASRVKTPVPRPVQKTGPLPRMTSQSPQSTQGAMSMSPRPDGAYKSLTKATPPPPQTD